ncbi:MAG: type II toxin-antitoxin system VapC family toxin, partial [Flavobacteriales bacterium]
MSAVLRVFLDTNVLIDLFDAARPQHVASTEVMRAIQRGRIRACISAISIVNAIYVLRKVMPPERMATHLQHMLRTVEISRLETQDMLLVLASGWNDLEDAIQYHTAMASGRIDAI